MDNTLKRILYLEDDDFIAELALMTLEEMTDFEVLHCASGRAAIDAFPAFSPQLLLFDVMLPELDGLETLAAIRAIDRGRKVPVIFMTAKAQVHEQRAYFDLGACGVIVKPFDPLTLGREIEALWRGARGRGAVA